MKFEVKNGYISDFDDEGEIVKEISIPDGVTRIEWEFYGLESLETVIMPDSIAYIDREAFSRCVNLKNIRFSKNLKYIGEDAFEETLWLKEQQNDFVIISDSILYKYLGHEKDVVIPECVTTISPSAFEENESIETITMSDNVKEIGYAAFNKCSNLKKICISKNISCIKEFTFSGCISMQRIEIPENVKIIKECAFLGCKSLKEIIIHKKTSYSVTAFYRTGLEYDLIIPLEYDEFNLSYNDEDKEYCFSFSSSDKSKNFRIYEVRPKTLDYKVFRDITTGKYGYKNKINEVIIKPDFLAAFPFNDDGFAVVMTEDLRYVVINIYGEFVTDNYKFIKPVFLDRAAAVYNYGHWGFVNMNNSYVVYPDFNEVSDCIGGHAAVKKDGKWGLIRINYKKNIIRV